MWQLRPSLSDCISFQDWAHLSPESTVPMHPHPHRSLTGYFSISVQFFSQVAPHSFGQHDSPSHLAESRYPPRYHSLSLHIFHEIFALYLCTLFWEYTPRVLLHDSCTYLYTYICMYVHIYICMHVYLCMYICVETHTHTSVYASTKIVPIDFWQGRLFLTLCRYIKSCIHAQTYLVERKTHTELCIHTIVIQNFM